MRFYWDFYDIHEEHADNVSNNVTMTDVWRMLNNDGIDWA